MSKSTDPAAKPPARRSGTPRSRPTSASRRSARLGLLIAALLAVGLSWGGCATSTSEAPAPAQERMPAPGSEPDGAMAEQPPSPPPRVQPPLPATPPGPSSPEGPVLCFHGPITETPLSLGGEPTVTADLVVRRTLRPAEDRIVEDSVRIDRGSNRPTRAFRTIYEVEGSAFTLREESGDYQGEGQFKGEPWQWTGWDFTYALTSGIRVRGRYEIRPQASDASGEPSSLMLVGDKTAMGPDGSEVLRLHEELDQVSPSECDERLPPVPAIVVPPESP